MDRNYLVTKSNYFIMNSSYDLSLEEQKLILTLASMVQPTDEEFKSYNFRIADFIELLGVEDKSKYTQVPKITKELMKKVFEIQEGNKIIQTAWISGAIYEKGSGMVTLKFNPDLKPYMLQLKEKFTQYQLANVLTMKSKYSPRIYEILKCNEFKKQGNTEVEIKDLRKLLRAENIYPLYADFKRFIILQAQKELKTLTDINFDFEEIKTGRKVTSLRFYIHSNKAKALDEVSAARMDINTEDPNITEVKFIIKNITGEEIGDKAADQIYKSAVKHKKYGNAPLDLIGEVAEYSKTQDIKSGLIGWLKTTVASYEKPIKTFKQNIYNNHKQKEYDIKSIERKLLGWDTEEEGAE